MPQGSHYDDNVKADEVTPPLTDLAHCLIEQGKPIAVTSPRDALPNTK